MLRKSNGLITNTVADDALTLLDIDRSGFDHMDRRLLLAMIEKFEGGPVGVDSLAAAISEERDTIEDAGALSDSARVYDENTRGRMVTKLAYDHFQIIPSST